MADRPNSLDSTRRLGVHLRPRDVRRFPRDPSPIYVSAKFPRDPSPIYVSAKVLINKYWEQSPGHDGQGRAFASAFQGNLFDALRHVGRFLASDHQLEGLVGRFLMHPRSFSDSSTVLNLWEQCPGGPNSQACPNASAVQSPLDIAEQWLTASFPFDLFRRRLTPTPTHAIQMSPAEERLSLTFPDHPPQHWLLDFVRPQTIVQYSFNHLANNVFKLVCSLPFPRLRPHHAPLILTKFMPSGGSAARGCLVGASMCNLNVVLRRPRHIAVYSLSARAACQYISRRTFCVPRNHCGLEKGSAEELMIWQRSLEEREKELNVGLMTMDTVRSGMYNSWINLGNVKRRLPPPGPFGLLKTVVLDKFTLFLKTAVGLVMSFTFVTVLSIQSSRPGETEQVPGNLIETLKDKAKSGQNIFRSWLGLPLLEVSKPLPGPPASPSPASSSVVVILGGNSPIFSGSIVDVPIAGSSVNQEADAEG